MGINIQTLEAILVPFDLAWNGTQIPRGDVNPRRAPQPYWQSLVSAGGLALLLHWLSSNMAAYKLQKIFLITAAVCSCDLVHVQDCLLAVPQDLKISQITWSSTKEAGGTVTWSRWSTLYSQTALVLLMVWSTFQSMLPMMKSEWEWCLFFALCC
jgi:hypothetical protein